MKKKNGTKQSRNLFLYNNVCAEHVILREKVGKYLTLYEKWLLNKFKTQQNVSNHSRNLAICWLVSFTPIFFTLNFQRWRFWFSCRKFSSETYNKYNMSGFARRLVFTLRHKTTRISNQYIDNTLHLVRKDVGYLSAVDIICSEKRTVFQGRSSSRNR